MSRMLFYRVGRLMKKWVCLLPKKLLPLSLKNIKEILRKKPGRTEYQRGVVSRNSNGELQVITTGNQGSGVLSSMVQANALIVLSHQQGTAQVGDWVDVLML